MINVRMTQLSTNFKALRTYEVIGYCEALPEVGKTFIMYSEPLNKNASIRLIETTEVIMFNNIDEKTIIINTLNSNYLIEII